VLDADDPRRDAAFVVERVGQARRDAVIPAERDQQVRPPSIL
jgi:hypothetical protein